MAIEGIVEILTFLLLFGAAINSLIHVLTRLREGKKVMNDFTVLISIFIVGWLSTEMATALSGGSIRQVMDFSHLLVLVTFAAALTFRWKWALREATESVRGTR